MPKDVKFRDVVVEVLEDTVKIGDHISATVTRAGRMVGFSESPREGRAAHMTVKDDGKIDFALSGPTSTGEHGTLDTCRTLILALNLAGGRWQPPEIENVEQDVDCVSTGELSQALKIQVVRAISNPAFWQQLHRTGQIEESGADAGVLAEAMFQSIVMKADKIPAEARRAITLALNAQDFPACASHEVIDRFRSDFQSAASEFAFAAVWVVGPAPQMVIRLDDLPPASSPHGQAEPTPERPIVHVVLKQQM